MIGQLGERDNFIVIVVARDFPDVVEHGGDRRRSGSKWSEPQSVQLIVFLDGALQIRQGRVDVAMMLGQYHRLDDL